MVFAEQLSHLLDRFGRVVTVPVNLGYGHGILSGLREAKGDYLAWTHADLQTDPADVVKAWELLTASPNPATNATLAPTPDVVLASTPASAMKYSRVSGLKAVRAKKRP